jgi:ABC-type transporter Mla subunit MlaD
MSSASERRRNNVRAGLLVSVTIFLAVAVVFVLSDALAAWTRPMRDYTVTFDVASGIRNLKKGADVRIGGVVMGKVSAVKPQISEGRAFETIRVEFSLDRRAELFADARVFVIAPLIGSGAWLEIFDVGDPARGQPPDRTLAGMTDPGLLTTLLGPAGAGKAEAIITDVRAVADDIRQVTGGIRESWPDWEASVDRVMNWAAEATDDLDAILATGQGAVTDARNGINEVREAVAANRPKVDATLEDAQAIGENVRAASEDVRAIAQTARSTTIEKVHAVLDRGQQAVDEAAGALSDIRTEFTGWAPEIDDALANANLSAQQLKLASIEIRRSPWKILYRPTSEELEHELLYEAARSFAVAAADLKAAGESVRRVLDEHGERLAADDQTLQRIQRNLLDSLSNYEKAQQRLFDVLMAE